MTFGKHFVYNFLFSPLLCHITRMLAVRVAPCLTQEFACYSPLHANLCKPCFKVARLCLLSSRQIETCGCCNCGPSRTSASSCTAWALLALHFAYCTIAGCSWDVCLAIAYFKNLQPRQVRVPLNRIRWVEE